MNNIDDYHIFVGLTFVFLILVCVRLLNVSTMTIKDNDVEYEIGDFSVTNTGREQLLQLVQDGYTVQVEGIDICSDVIEKTPDYKYWYIDSKTKKIQPDHNFIYDKQFINYMNEYYDVYYNGIKVDTTNMYIDNKKIEIRDNPIRLIFSEK